MSKLPDLTEYVLREEAKRKDAYDYTAVVVGLSRFMSVKDIKRALDIWYEQHPEVPKAEAGQRRSEK